MTNSFVRSESQPQRLSVLSAVAAQALQPQHQATIRQAYSPIVGDRQLDG